MERRSPSPSWKTQLVAFLSGSRRVAVLGVGNLLRGDDGAGTYAAVLLQDRLRRIAHNRSGIQDRLTVLPAGPVPENFLTVVTRFGPSHLICIDAFDGGFAPGTVSVLSRDVLGEQGWSSHRLPLSFIYDFLRGSGISAQLYLGIQSCQTTFGSSMTVPVEKACRRVARVLARLLSGVSSQHRPGCLQP